MAQININGVELSLDLMDADVMEAFENGFKETAEKIEEKSQYEGLSGSEQIRLQCKIIDGFFDNLFGEGTSDNLFKGKHHFGERMEAFGQVSGMSRQLKDETTKIIDKYNPERLNRAQRRAASKGKRSGGYNKSGNHR